MNLLKSFVLLGVLIPSIANAEWRWGNKHNNQDKCREERYSGASYGRSPLLGSSYGNSYSNRFVQRPYYDQIGYGVRSGQLSYREEAELRNQRANIERERYQYYRDGKLSRGEREDLSSDYREYQKDLNHELNDGEKRYFWR